jgi:hypothetical protein
MRIHVEFVSFSPDGKLLAAISSGQRLVVGDVATLKPIYESPEVLGTLLGEDTGRELRAPKILPCLWYAD